MQKTIQFLIPAYNEENNIRQTLNSVLLSDSSRVSILISDNCSTDRTYDICKEIERNTPRVSVIRQESNIGPSRNMWGLAQRAKGDYVQFLGAHDLLSSDYVRECLHYIDVSSPEYLVPIPQMLLNTIPSSQPVIDSRSALKHKAYLSENQLSRYISGIRYWPVNWFYSLMRKDVFDSALKSINDFNTINCDHLLVSYLLFLAKPTYMPSASLIFRSMQRTLGENYTSRLGFVNSNYSGFYQDRLWWAICYYYHFEKIVGSKLSQDRSAMRPWLSAGATAISRLAGGPSVSNTLAKIMANLIDYSESPIRYME